jgi:hypothetical protein
MLGIDFVLNKSIYTALGKNQTYCKKVTTLHVESIDILPFSEGEY